MINVPDNRPGLREAFANRLTEMKAPEGLVKMPPQAWGKFFEEGWILYIRHNYPKKGMSQCQIREPR